jgi:8-oxo-dGTP pyrophosphatase MutT (NUDIX family)
MIETPLERPAVTVAAIVERDGRFLVVREQTNGGVRINQPAGHLERGETPAEGAARETLEEAAWHIEPYALVGIYRWEAPDNGATFVRFAYAARPLRKETDRVLDEGIVDSLWLSYEELAARRDEHRSPLVLRCVDDYRAGARWPVDFVLDVRGPGGGRD